MERCIPICETAGYTVTKFLRKILKDAYTHHLIAKDIRDKIIEGNRKIPDLKLFTKEELVKFIQEASKHPGCYFEILLRTEKDKGKRSSIMIMYLSLHTVKGKRRGLCFHQLSESAIMHMFIQYLSIPYDINLQPC